MFEYNPMQAALPAQDLERGKSWYADKLGLKPDEEFYGHAVYNLGKGSFMLFESSGAATGDHTQLNWNVDDIDAVVEELRSRGVVFEEYDFPGLKTVGGIAQIPGERAAWFKDSEGNLLAIGQRE